MQSVQCINRCTDSTTSRRYHPGDVDSIDPMNPIAQYFDGWAPGTVVYQKIKGDKLTAAKGGTKTIPGLVVTKPEAKPEANSDGGNSGSCPDCGKGPFSNMGAHKQHCKGKE